MATKISRFYLSPFAANSAAAPTGPAGGAGSSGTKYNVTQNGVALGSANIPGSVGGGTSGGGQAL